MHVNIYDKLAPQCFYENKKNGYRLVREYHLSEENTDCRSSYRIYKKNNKQRWIDTI